MTPARLSQLLVAATPSGARQSHGFIFQSGISLLLKLYVPAYYTDEVDAYSIQQPDDVVLRHSFKNMKSGTAVELGDLHRNATVTRDFAMYVGFWEGFKTNIREVCVMRVRAEYWRNLFPDDIRPFLAAQAFSVIT